MPYKGRHIVLLILGVLFFIEDNPVFSQDQIKQKSSFSIQFIKSISSHADIFEPTFIDAISDFVFGEQKKSFIKPISIFAQDSSMYWILDQGLKNLVYINEEKEKFENINLFEECPSLISICKVGKSKLLFTDSKSNKIYYYDYSTGNQGVFCAFENLNKPTGIAFSDKSNEVWVVQTGNHSILVLDRNGAFVKNIGKRGSGNEEFNFPTHIWIDKDGNVYIVDSMNFRIQIFNSSGEFISTFGELGDATGYFARPKGLSTDSYGNIYVVDALFHNVQIFDPNGKYLSNFGSHGKNNGNFWLPNGIFIDSFDRIYIADSYNSRIQLFQLVRNKNENN